MKVSEERLQATQELHALLVDYWHDVDTNWGRNAGDYYTDDALFEARLASYHGKKKIQEFYQWRLDRGPRVALHLVDNFRVAEMTSEGAVCTWFLLLYAADGEPILPSNPPIQIAYMIDQMVRTKDGGWLVKHRKFSPWFEGGAPTTNPNLDNN
jgi:hypothetical protein